VGTYPWTVIQNKLHFTVAKTEFTPLDWSYLNRRNRILNPPQIWNECTPNIVGCRPDRGMVARGLGKSGDFGVHARSAWSHASPPKNKTFATQRPTLPEPAPESAGLIYSVIKLKISSKSLVESPWRLLIDSNFLRRTSATRASIVSLATTQ